MAKDRELQDHERAHTGKAGAKVRHGNDATGKWWEGGEKSRQPFWSPDKVGNLMGNLGASEDEVKSVITSVKRRRESND